MSAAVAGSPEPDQATRLLLGMTPPPGRIRTLLDLITADEMDSPDVNPTTRPPGGESRWWILKRRLRLKGIGCGCWGGMVATCPPQNRVVAVEVAELERQGVEQIETREAGIAPPGGGTGMNLAMALAAKREVGGVEETAEERVSLRNLLVDEMEEGVEKGCCVCMERKKGAAIIPCGHTYCRECCRQVWLSRGSCPLCNRPILDILHLY